MSKLHVLQLTGSPKDTFHEQLSLTYARDSADSLGEHADFLFLHTSADGQHFILSSLDADAIAKAQPISLGHAIEAIQLMKPDLALPQMFCEEGMTTYRSLLDLLGIRFIGNNAHTMALTHNKARTRSLVSAAGVSVPAAVLIDFGNRSWQSEQSRSEAFSRFEFPVVVKPSRSDNSMGVTLVESADELSHAITEAATFSSEVLVEQFIAPGREVRCGVVETGGELRCLPLQEYGVDAENPIRLPAGKLTHQNDGSIELTSRLKKTSFAVSIDDPINQAVHEQARMAHVALGCRDYSLFDFRIDRDGHPWFLEAGLYCSFANSSVISTMARYAGIEVCDLFLQLANQDNNENNNESELLHAC